MRKDYSLTRMFKDLLKTITVFFCSAAFMLQSSEWFSFFEFSASYILAFCALIFILLNFALLKQIALSEGGLNSFNNQVSKI
jgi:hypothetical protein